MRLRNVLLAVWGVLLIAGLAFYYGRWSVRTGTPAETPQELQARQHQYPVETTEQREEAKEQREERLEQQPEEEGARARRSEPDLRPLVQRKLTFPVPGVESENVHDSFNDARGGNRVHEATDIMAPRGTPVLAVDDGVVAKLFLSKPGGVTLYHFDPSEKYCYYYAHLDRYADGIREGMQVRRGQLLGYVGTTGNADPGAPHLHFAIFELGPEKKYWEGTPLNPYPLLMRALN
jgi:murein DD-endopeptidase MepM/ murein hydrolase activator NlpD